MLVESEKLAVKFFPVTNILSYGLGKFVGLHVFILIHPT